MAFMPYNLNKCINYRTNKHPKVTSLRDINQDFLFHAMFNKRDFKKNNNRLLQESIQISYNCFLFESHF